MRKLIFILVMLVSISATTNAQSLMGTTGWLNIPSAEMQEDGTFFVGGSFINEKYIESYGGGDYNAANYYLNITFLPFLEVKFGNTRLLNYDGDYATVDRNISVRFRAVRERKFVPAIVIGAHDLYTSIAKDKNTNQWFSSLYIVATKHIAVNKSEFGVTLGYGFDVFRENQFVGLFGGVSFSPSFARQLTLIAEYDTKGFNVGGNVLFFKHLFVYAMVYDLNSFSGGFAYRVYLLNNLKKNRKKKK